MVLFKHVGTLQAFLTRRQAVGQTVGFVPTMGALHEGHLALVRQSRTENSLTVTSIFVNPTQFNQKDDLAAYPRLPGPDIAALDEAQCDVLFMPEAREVYPPGLNTDLRIDLNGLDQVMEGAFRPGHFTGVAQVVDRLLTIVNPQRLYMGQKDYQQATIIRHLLRETGRPTRLRVHPTVREADGVAMSSRNLRLEEEHRPRAIRLYQTLQWAKEALSNGMAVLTIEKEAMERLQQPGFRPEYFSVVDGISLQSVIDPRQHEHIVACVACWAGDVRLIDNLTLRAPNGTNRWDG